MLLFRFILVMSDLSVRISRTMTVDNWNALEGAITHELEQGQSSSTAKSPDLSHVVVEMVRKGYGPHTVSDNPDHPWSNTYYVVDGNPAWQDTGWSRTDYFQPALFA